MSAREVLIRSVYQKLSQNQMEELVDDFAHELAAQQRAWASEFGTTPTQQALRSIINETADLIDPEVEK